MMHIHRIFLAWVISITCISPLLAAPAKPQRAGGIKPELTLEEIAQAFDAADASPTAISSKELTRLDHLVRNAADALCPQVAELALKLKQPALWKKLVPQAFAEWSLFDGAAAAKRIETIDDPERKEAAWNTAVQVWRQRDTAGCWRYLVAQPDSVRRDHDMQRFLESLSFTDPRRTLELMAEVKNPAIRERTLDEMAWRWAEKDADAALAWVNGLPDTAQRDKLIPRVVLGVTSKNKEAGAALAMSLPDPKLKREMVNEVHRGWSNFNIQAAVTAFLKLPSSLRDAQTFQHFGFSTEKLDVAEILRIADQLAAIEGARDVFLERAANRKESQGRPEDAIALLSPLPQAQLRAQGFQSLAMNWATKDNSPAAAWVTTLPAGADREKAIEGLTWGLLPGKPAEAMAWAERLSDHDTRASARRNLYANWSKNNAANARAWLDSNATLSAAEKEECLKQAEMTKVFNISF